jgi:N-acyl-phosphatidylethanolamine-hydrolysing phospholipase D
VAALGTLALLGCACARLSFVVRALPASADALLSSPAVPRRVADPVRHDARLAVLWVGHATTLIQIEDKLVLTDPVFTSTVGQLSKRLVEPGLLPEAVPPVDVALISHVHFDHLSVGSLELLESRIGRLVVPEPALVYVPDLAFPVSTLRPWASVDIDGVRVTATPVDHVGFRYGLDDAWMGRAFTGYVIEHRGVKVYFGGDTAYDAALFRETRRRFPDLDLALIPIAPIHPREHMKRTHLDPEEAVQAFLDLGAKRMIAIHHATFVNSLDAPGEPVARLRDAMNRRGLTDREVIVLAIGEQRVLIPR